MQQFFKLPVYLLAAGLLLGSCSDISMFTPSVGDSVAVKILSLSEGDFLESGDSIDFVIQAEDQSSAPELLEIELIAQSGQSVWNTSISSPLTDEELELLLPDLETGQYTVVFTIQGAEGVVEEKQLDFFYIAGLYDILGISSYPPTTMAGHETVIEADLLYPAGANPYVRWSQEDTVLAKGLAADGLASIAWMAPGEEGVYPVRVEVFPVPPPSGTDFPFSSSLALTAQLYVTTARVLTEDELVPEDSYYSLFHLNGSLQDSGLLGEVAAAEARLIGQTRLSTEKGVIGYETGSGSGLFYPFNILPIQDGELTPATITIKVLPMADNRDRALMVITGRNQRFKLRMFFDSEGQLVATIAVGDSLLYLPSNIFALDPEQHYRLDLSLVPSEESLQALWFLDGRQTAFLIEAPLPADLPGNGETVIAGENGFTGIVTELGVYYRDALDRPSVDPAIYRSTMQQEHGRRLVLAEGFEGLYLPDPDSWRLQSDDPAGLRGGRLMLPASSSLTLPYFELGKEDTAFLVEFFGDIPSGSTVALKWEGAENPFLIIDPAGEMMPESEEAKEYVPASGHFRLILASRGVTLATADAPILYPFPSPTDSHTWLSVTLRSPAESGELAIDTILIVQEQKP